MEDSLKGCSDSWFDWLNHRKEKKKSSWDCNSFTNVVTLGDWKNGYLMLRLQRPTWGKRQFPEILLLLE